MLGGAQKIILLIFIVLLILIFGIVLWTFIKGNLDSWPPTSQTCPDYWKLTTDNKCKPNQVYGSCGTTKEIDFSSSTLTNCEKYKWSKGTTGPNIDNGNVCSTSLTIDWDGINYGFGKYTPCEDGYNPGNL